jgi:hypothetical protein
MQAAATEQVREIWTAKLTAALDAVRARQSVASDLIEIAAQHPLIDGTGPDPEFTARLERGAELYRQSLAAGRAAEIYVPGSRFMDNGIEDKITLSAAGTRYLVGQGIPAASVHGDDLNDRYKGPGAAQPGVYCSADECFVAARYWTDSGFGRLLSVVSAGQLLRKMLHFVEFGVYPLMYSAPTLEAAHDPVIEALLMIPEVLFEDAGLQAPDARRAMAFRRSRMPGYVPPASVTVPPS